MTHLIVQYSYLQVLDFLSTIAFLAYGVQEGNPLVRYCIEVTSSPVAGLLVVKGGAVLLGIIAWRMNRHRLLARVNVFFALLVTWNLFALILGAVGTA